MSNNLRKLIFLAIGIFVVISILALAAPFWDRLERYTPAGLETFLNHSFGRKSLAERRAKRPEISITIKEGENLKDVATKLAQAGLIDEESFYRFVGRPKVDYRLEDSSVWPKDYSDKFAFLQDKPAYYSLEGYLFPDTYRFFASSSPDEIITKILENFDKKLTPDLRAEIKKQGRSIFEIITMASIIEKEAPINYQTGNSEDAKIISGIFWKRLRQDQALQSCATLAYVLGENKPQYSEADTRVDSPFNTYAHRGLTPAPIANPGLLAIKAAISPIDSDYQYFLTPAGSKDIIFSRTYEEHLDKKHRYLDNK